MYYFYVKLTEFIQYIELNCMLFIYIIIIQTLIHFHRYIFLTIKFNVNFQ